MAAITTMNINSFVSLFLSTNTGVLAAAWRESDVDGVMQVWESWCGDQKEESPFLVKGKVTKKSKMTEEIVTQVFKTFIETFGAVLFAESVWDSVNKTVYSRMVVALVNDKQVQDTLKGELAKLKTVKNTSSGKKQGGSTRNKSAYLYCCAHFRESVKSENPDLSPQEITKLLGKKWDVISKSSDAADKALFDKFTQIAKDDKQRYELENPKVAKPKAERAPKTEKKPKKKRGKSAWVIFCDIKRPDVKEKLGEAATNKQVMFELGQMWASNEYTSLKILAEKKSLEDKERVKELLASSSSDEETDNSVVKEPVKEPVKKEPVSAVSPAALKLNILLNNDDEELEEEDEDLDMNAMNMVSFD